MIERLDKKMQSLQGRMEYLEIHHRQRVSRGQAQKAQNLEHLDGVDKSRPALLDDVCAGQNIVDLGCER